MSRSSEPPGAATPAVTPAVTPGLAAGEVHLVDTPGGLARLTVHRPGSRLRGTLVLGHGAGGGIGAPDLVTATVAALDSGWQGVLVEQPWLLAGRLVAVAPPRLDAAWTAALTALGASGGFDPDRPLVLGGRSAGARVACRTAQALHARAVLALAFPLHPPGRPERSRAGELALAGVPLLVVQGRRDPFGTAGEIRAALAEQRLDGPGGDVEVLEVDGDHGLKAEPQKIAVVVSGYLDRIATSS